jgi:hypothetical protein
MLINPCHAVQDINYESTTGKQTHSDFRLALQLPISHAVKLVIKRLIDLIQPLYSRINGVFIPLSHCPIQIQSMNLVVRFLYSTWDQQYKENIFPRTLRCVMLKLTRVVLPVALINCLQLRTKIETLNRPSSELSELIANPKAHSHSLKILFSHEPHN